MPNSINSLSPTFRDYLLLKNLVTDTVVDNGLESLLGSIGRPTEIENLPNAVQPSNSISNTGPFYQELNTILNQYQGTENDYTQVDIVFNNSINSTITQSGLYTSNNELLNGQFYYNGNFITSESLRQNLTSKNVYVDKPKQTVVDLKTQPVTAYQNLTSYLDENNNLNVGGPSTQALDILAGVATGQGVGFSAGGGLVANEDIRSTLLGRVLGATGIINDTQLGNIGGQQLLAHVGYNAAFGLQQETLGSLNLNPLSLLQGKSLVTLNYSITVPKGTTGKVLNFAANVLGVQSPVSLLQQSIYTFDNKGGFITIGNIERGNEIIKNSGKGQVNSLFNHLRANTNISNPDGTSLRQGYAPGYTDDRKVKGENVGDGINPILYSRDNGKGEIIDFLNGTVNSPVASTNYELSKQISDDGWDKSSFRKTDYNSQKGGKAKLYKDAFGWQDSKFNKDSNTLAGTAPGSTTLFLDTNDNKNRFKTLLSKTDSLFKRANLRTLVSGHGIKETDGPTQINSAVSRTGNYTSKGSGVMSKVAVENGTDNGPENVFCRTWTTYDRYAQVLDLQKNRGLYGGEKNGVSRLIFRRNTEFSVLEDNGFARVAPYKTDSMAQIVDAEGTTSAGNKLKTYKGDTDNKRYMFSIENLAWNDNLFNLLPCEVGPGDTLSGHRGRIMWFPPYEINFSETTSANWDKHNFIGRGEPIYTYNNTERSGNLSWKIIIDHPNYLNFIGKSPGITTTNYDDFLASYFAGCIPQDILTQQEIAVTEVVNVEKKPEEKKEPDKEPAQFDVYFPNDVYDIEKYPDYEDGKCKDNSSKNLLFKLTGHTDIVVTSEFNKDSSKVVTASFDKTAKIFNSSDGLLLFTLAGHTDVLTSSKFSNDGSKVVTSSTDNTAKIWDSSTGNLLFTLAGHTDGINYAEFNSDGSKIVTASYDNTAKILNVSNGSLLFTLAGHTDFVNYAKFNPSGTKIITGSNDFDAKIWDVSNGNELLSLTGSGAVLTVEFNSSDTKALTAYDVNVVKIWDTSNGDELLIINNTSSVAKFNTDGSKFISSIGNDAKIFNSSDGTLLLTLAGHTDFVRYSEFNQDSSKVVTASNDKTAKIWEDGSSVALVTLEGHENEVNMAKFNTDGTKVVTASNDKTAIIWNAEKTECSIDYTTNTTGEGFGLGTYNETCYQYKLNDKDRWSTESFCAKKIPPGPKGSDGRKQPDRFNYGLNASGGTEAIKGFFKPIKLGDKKYKSFRDKEYAKDLQTYLETKCQSCKITIVGYASEQGTNEQNKILSELRGESLKKWLKENVLKPPFSDRITVNATGGGATETRGKGCTKKASTDIQDCKTNRYVTVKFTPEPNLIPKETPEKIPEKIPAPPKVPNIPASRFYSECDYFEKLQSTDPIAYSTIREKIKYFQPAFHSTTPEGFNSRLNFLQQCMRQGSTQGAGNTNNPDNLAFGRPPICILRIGDFYHTKIVIENISFNFEPLVWDLNPEGVGVQPMICNVDMSFSFIGGSSLRGPINKLQNAVSFNYYANTEIYDPRADTIKITEGSGVIVNGEKSVAADFNVSPLAQQIAGLTAQVEPNLNQLNQNANANAGAQPLTTTTGTTTGDTVNNNTSPDDTLFSNSLIFGNFIFTIGYSGTNLKGRFGIVSSTKLSKEYDAKLSLITASGNIDIATFKIGTENYGDYLSAKDGWKEALMLASETNLSPSTSNIKKSNVIFQIEVLDLKYKFYADRAIAQFECPEEDILLGDIVDTSDWDYILQDPCCACWPNGTSNKDIIINSVKCSKTGCVDS